MVPGEFVWTGGDTHLYSNHLEQAKLQLTREPRPLPDVEIRNGPGIFQIKASDIELVGYDPGPFVVRPDRTWSGQRGLHYPTPPPLAPDQMVGFPQ